MGKASGTEDIELGPVINYFDYMDNEQENKKFRKKIRKLKQKANKRTSALKTNQTTPSNTKKDGFAPMTLGSYINSTHLPEFKYDLGSFFNHINFPGLKSAAMAAIRSLDNITRSNVQRPKAKAKKQKQKASSSSSNVDPTSAYQINLNTLS